MKHCLFSIYDIMTLVELQGVVVFTFLNFFTIIMRKCLPNSLVITTVFTSEIGGRHSYCGRLSFICWRDLIYFQIEK